MLAYANRGRYLVAAGGSDVITIYDTQAETFWTRRIEGGVVNCLATDGDRIVATGGSDLKTRLWEVSQLGASDPRRAAGGPAEPARVRSLPSHSRRTGNWSRRGTSPRRSSCGIGRDNSSVRSATGRGQAITCVRLDQLRPDARRGSPGPGHGALGAERLEKRTSPTPCRKDGIEAAPENVMSLAFTNDHPAC